MARLAMAFCMVFLALLLTPMQGIGQAAAQERRAKPALILGLGWQPAFCARQSRRPECREQLGGQAGGQAEATRFSLQGLWSPGKRFCGVDEAMRKRDRGRDWMSLPALAVSAPLEARLKRAMPGVASGLDRHVWLMNGGCQARTQEAYFDLQLRLLEAVNASAVARLFAERAGQTVDRAAVQAAFAESFGAGSGLRVKMRCRRTGERMRVTGLTIGLGPLDEQGPAEEALRAAIAAAPETRFGCESGVLDRAGGAAGGG